MPRPQQTSLSAGRAGNRWQPVVGPQLRRRVAGRRAWRMPKLYVPVITIRWWLTAAIALIAAGLIAGGWWVYQSPLLTVRSVSVEGNSALLPEVVRNIAGVKGESLIRPDFAAAEERLRAVSMIKDVKIERTFPMGARITIVERRPWGYWQLGFQRVVVDDEGIVIDLLPPQGAPVVVQTDFPVTPLALGDQVDSGAVAVAAQLAMTAQQTLGRPLVAMEYSKADGLTAVLEGDLRAVFGAAQGYDFKIATLSAILQRAAAQGQTLHRVDLRFGDRVTVQ